MTKILLVLGIAAAVTVTGVTMWKADATPLVGATGSLAVIKGYSIVEKTGCVFGTSRCPAGTKWSCSSTTGPNGERKFCHCRPC